MNKKKNKRKKNNLMKLFVSDVPEINEEIIEEDYTASEEYENTLYKKNKDINSFTYFTPKQFNTYQEENPARILGNVNLNKKFKEKDEEEKLDDGVIGILHIKYTDDYIQQNKPEFPYQKFDITEGKKCRCLGYAYVGNNQFVRITKKSFLFLLWIFIGLLILFGCYYASVLCGVVPDKYIPDFLPVIEGEDWDGNLDQGENSEQEMEQTEIPGYANLSVTKDYPTINLINPTGNLVYFKYVIKENDEVLYTTDLIPPGKMLKTDFYNFLPEGEHTLTFVISCYDVKTQAACNGANQTVKVTVK